jgi:four helix bundle protein
VPGFGASLVSAALGVGIEIAPALPTQHKNTRIHGKAIELIRIAAKVIRSVPPGHADLVNQLRRASSSVALNLRTAAVTSRPKSGRFFIMARASANEVSMIFDVANAYGAVDDETCARQGRVRPPRCDAVQVPLTVPLGPTPRAAETSDAPKPGTRSPSPETDDRDRWPRPTTEARRARYRSKPLR